MESQIKATQLPARDPRLADLRIVMPGSPFGVAWGFLYGYAGMKAEIYMPQMRELGGGFTKIYLFWNQVETEKSRYDWSAVDSFLNQLSSPDEGLIAVFSASQWATRKPSMMLPPSAARDPEDYFRFVYNLVLHCKGRVRYWQNDSEPNNPVFWSGSREEFVSQLKVFYKAVKTADPSAAVVVGGYDGFFNPPGMPPFPGQQAGLDFFDYVLAEGHDAFDIFDLRLYGNPYTIVGRVNVMRQKMLGLGYIKPIISTEYGGPNLLEFHANHQYIPLIQSWTQEVANQDHNSARSPANQIGNLYKNMASLAEETQMFMLDCPSTLNAKHERIQARGLVMRNLLALSAGVQKTIYWQFLNIHGNRDDLMTLMYGKIGMVGYENAVLKKRYLVADVFERMVRFLSGVVAVEQLNLSEKPNIFLFRVDREKRGPLFVAWERRDQFSGEDSDDIPFEWKWQANGARCTDALGESIPCHVANGVLHFNLSLTPVFIEPLQ